MLHPYIFLIFVVAGSLLNEIASLQSSQRENINIKTWNRNFQTKYKMSDQIAGQSYQAPRLSNRGKYPHNHINYPANEKHSNKQTSFRNNETRFHNTENGSCGTAHISNNEWFMLRTKFSDQTQPQEQKESWHAVSKDVQQSNKKTERLSWKTIDNAVQQMHIEKKSVETSEEYIRMKAEIEPNVIENVQQTRKKNETEVTLGEGNSYIKVETESGQTVNKGKDILRMKRESGPSQVAYDPLLDEKLIFTCKDRCGKSKDFPCSCSPSCILFDTCCENITQDCPQVVTEGYTKFNQFFGASIECSSRNVYFIQTSPCTPGPPADVVQLGKYSLDDLQYYVLNAPVTDKVLGLSFINENVYDCYINLLNLTNNIMRWGVSVRYIPSLTYQDSVVNGYISGTPYEPSFKNKYLDDQWCDRNAIHSCDDEFVTDTALAQQYGPKCREFAGYVRQASQPFRIFRNRYCLYCYERGGYPLELYRIYSRYRSEFDFEILVSLSDGGGYVLELLTFSSENKGLVPSWSSAKCDDLHLLDSGEKTEEKGNKTESESGKGCKVLACGDSNFEPDSGVCKAEYHMLIAFEKNEQDLSPCPIDASQIGDFMSCSLDLLLDSDEWEHVSKLSTHSVSVMTEMKTNQTFYFVDIFFLSSVKPDGQNQFAFMNKNFLSNFHKLAVAVRAFHLHQPPRNFTCPFNEYEKDEDGHLNGKTFEMTNEILEGWTSQRNIDYMKTIQIVPFRGEVISRENTTVCFSSFLPLSVSLKPQCLEDFTYELDQAQASDVLNSSCANYLLPKATPTSTVQSNSVPSTYMAQLCYFKLCILVYVQRLLFAGSYLLHRRTCL